MPRDDFLLSPEEVRSRERKRRRRIFIGVVVILVLAAGYFGARPTLHAVKAWQARRHAEKAFALIEQENWNDARTESTAAYQLRPTEPQALRAVARFLSRTRQPQALEFWDLLAQQQPLTREDRRDEATVALAAGEIERAAAVVAQLVDNTAQQPAARDWLLDAQLRAQEGATAQLLEAVRKILDDPKATPRERFHATLLQAQPALEDAEANRKNQAEVLERLVTFAKGDDEVALDALALLSRQAFLATANASQTEGKAIASLSELFPTAELITRVKNHPLARASHLLMAADLEMQLHPAEKESLIDHAIAQWKDAGPESRTVLATWLNGHGEYERVLDTITLEQSLEARGLFLQRVDALGALGRWEEIERLLDSERFPLEPVVQRMYLARCSAQLGKNAAEQNNWQRALEAARGDVGQLMTLADYAEKNGAREIAGTAFATAASVAPQLRPAQQGRLRLAQANGDTKGMHEILAEMLKYWPNDRAVQNDEAYTRLLLLSGDAGEEKVEITKSKVESQLSEIAALAEDLVKREPASLPHRTLLALARLKQDRPAEALAVYEKIQTPAQALTPSALAVHAAVLAANGHQADARTEIAQIPADQLLPEEKALIDAL